MADLVPSFIFRLATFSMFTMVGVVLGEMVFFNWAMWAWAVNMAGLGLSFMVRLAFSIMFTMLGVIWGEVVGVRFFKWVAFSGLVVGFIPGDTRDIWVSLKLAIQGGPQSCS